MTETALPPLSLMGSLRWDVVQRLIPDRAGLAILEVGCGQGGIGARLAPGNDYLGVELDAVSAATASQRLAALGCGEVRHGELSVVDADRVFDLVLALEVIEHLEDDARALLDWAGWLRPGGSLIVSTPAYPDRFGPMDELVGHFRRYEPDDLLALLRGAGLVGTALVHYGAPVAYAIEPVRNLVARWQLRRTPVVSMAERTSQSGRTLQPSGRVVGAVIAGATAPAKAVQRRFPQRGPALIAHGRRPVA